MKSFVVLTFLFSSVLLFDQVIGHEPKKAQLNLFKGLNELKPDTLKHIFTPILKGLQKHASNDQNHKETMESETNGLAKQILEDCHYGDIEEKFARLVEISVLLATNMSGSIEVIFDKITVCASKGFPQSIACYLSLVKACEVQIKEIQEAKDYYGAEINYLVNGIYKDIAECFKF